MGENRHDEFRETADLASKYLCAPHTAPKADSLERWSFLLRLWHYPAFTENRAWGIYRLHERGSRHVRTLVRQVTWNRPFDAERFCLPLVGLQHGFQRHPTIEIRDRPIDGEEWDKRIAALSTIAFPAFAARGLGIDGESFGVEHPLHRASVEWWCAGPESWSALTTWAAEVREWLETVTSAPPDPEIWIRPRPRLP